MIEAHRTNAGYASGGLFPEEDVSSAFMDDIIFSSSLFFICLWKWDLRNNEQSITGSDIPFFRTLTPFIPPFGQIVGIEQSLISQPEFCSSTTLIWDFGVQALDLSSYLLVKFFMFSLICFSPFLSASGEKWRGSVSVICFCIFSCLFHVVTEERRFDWKGRGGRIGGVGFRLVWGGFTCVHLSI